MRLRRPWSAAGFTLLELMVALAIGGTVTLTAAATAAALPELTGRADAELRTIVSAVGVRDQIRSWLRASYAAVDSIHNRAFIGVDGAELGDDALMFPVIAPTPGLSGRATIVLGIAGSGTGLVADILPERGQALHLRLAPAATGLEVRHLYFVSGVPRWFKGWSSEVERPAAVELLLIGPELPPLLRLPITVWLRT